MRPAIVLMGVAYEVAVEHVAGSLVRQGHLAPADLDEKAAKLLGKVRNQVKKPSRTASNSSPRMRPVTCRPAPQAPQRRRSHDARLWL